MPERATERMDSESFPAWAEAREGRWELIDGVPLAMAGAQERHDQIVVNAVSSLRPQMRGGRCRVFTGDTGVVVPTGSVRRPDVGIDCGPRRPDALVALAPKLVMEVLSPSTSHIDQMVKIEEYRAVDGLDHVISVDPTVVEVAVSSRGNDGWVFTTYDCLQDGIVLEALGMRLSLADLYEDVPLAPRLVT